MLPGFYVYLGECRLLAQFCLAGEDEDGDLCITGTRFEVHIDFLELFEPVMNIVVE